MNEKFKYLGKNTLIFAISSFGTKLLSFFLVPLYTNILSTSEYGTVDILTSTATLLIFIFTLNISDGVLRFALDKKEDSKEIFTYGLSVLSKGALLLSILLLIVRCTGLLDWANHYYIFLIIYFILNTLYEIISNYLRAIDKVKDVAVIGIISSLALIVSNLFLLLVLKIGMTGYLISILVGPLVAILYGVSKLDYSFTDLKNICDDKTKQEINSYCRPLVINSLALWINGYLDKYFITAICGIGENGIYSVASKIPSILAICYSIFSQAWTLSAVRDYDAEDKDGFISNTYKIYNSLLVCVCSILILLNIPLARFLYAKDFFEAWKYSSVLLIAIMFNAMTAFLGGLFSATKNSKILAFTTILSALTNTILNAILIPIMGTLGAAIATAIAYAVMFLSRYYVIKKYIKLDTNIILEISLYILLSIQVVFEHLSNHFYIGQIIIVILIFVLNIKNIKKIFNLSLEWIKKCNLNEFNK